jgi:site-specific recombinase XerD
MTQTATGRALPLAALLDSWILDLQAQNKSPYTIRSYGDSVRQLIAWAQADATTGITTRQLRDFFRAELGRTYGRHGRQVSPASVAVHFRNLRVFFGWCAREEPALMAASPMAGVSAPAVPAGKKLPFSVPEQSALLSACKGASFADRRDHAIMSVLIDTGMRVSGLAGLRLRYADAAGDERTDVRLKDRRLDIRLKGGRALTVPVGRKTAADCDRYIRARARHRHAGEDLLWLAPRGALTSWGIRQMLERRGEQAGVQDVHPHRFRGTFAHDWLLNGGSETDLMEITGWETRAMIEVYARQLRATRAGVSHARLSPRDRI